MTTESPPAAAMAAASQFTIPSCSHRHRAPDLDRLLGVDRAQLGAAEHVDELDRPGGGDGVAKRRVGVETEDLPLVRIDRDDVVAVPHERAHDAVRGPVWVGRRPDHGDPTGRPERSFDAGVVEERDGAPAFGQVEQGARPPAVRLASRPLGRRLLWGHGVGIWPSTTTPVLMEPSARPATVVAKRSRTAGETSAS